MTLISVFLSCNTIPNCYIAWGGKVLFQDFPIDLSYLNLTFFPLLSHRFRGNMPYLIFRLINLNLGNKNLVPFLALSASQLHLWSYFLAQFTFQIFYHSPQNLKDLNGDSWLPWTHSFIFPKYLIFTTAAILIHSVMIIIVPILFSYHVHSIS